MKVLGERSSSWIAIALLAVFVTLVLMAGAQKSETIDEGLFIAGGAAQVRHFNPNVDLTHPPLLRWLSGVSTTVLGRARLPEPVPFVPDRPIELFPYKVQDVFGFGVRFFYDAGNVHDRVLFWGRFPFAFLGALLGWLVFQQVRRHFGVAPAFGALLAFLFTPEVLAHAQWAHSDLASALTVFLVSLALVKGLLEPSWRGDFLLGAAMGLAVATKLTALVLWPVVLALLAAFERRGLLEFVKRAAVSLAVFYVAVIVAYLPDPRIAVPHEFYPSDLTRLGLEWLEPGLRVAPLPDSFLKGIVYTALLGQRGQVAYFHGQVGSTGWWYYFPIAIFLKYPTGLLLVAIAGAAALWRGRLAWTFGAAFTFPPLAILGAAMVQSVNTGVRAVLPIAPFLAFWSGAALWAWHGRGRALIMVLLATSVVSGVAAYPNFLAYFNPLIGGKAAADKWLVDSNIDWGQDLPGLANELKHRGIQDVRLAYFGMARPSHYGIRALDPRVMMPGWYAVSRSYLSGWWPPGDQYGWLRGFRPVALVGGSIALFHVDEEALARRREDARRQPMRDVMGDAEERMMKAGLEALYTRRDPDGAAAQFRKMLERNPTHYGATFQLAMALDRAGKAAEARPLWEQVLRMAEGYRDTQTAETARVRLQTGP